MALQAAPVCVAVNANHAHEGHMEPSWDHHTYKYGPHEGHIGPHEAPRRATGGGNHRRAACATGGLHAHNTNPSHLLSVCEITVLPAPHLSPLTQHHQHLFCARLDFAVDDAQGGKGLVVSEVGGRTCCAGSVGCRGLGVHMRQPKK